MRVVLKDTIFPAVLMQETCSHDMRITITLDRFQSPVLWIYSHPLCFCAHGVFVFRVALTLVTLWQRDYV